MKQRLKLPQQNLRRLRSPSSAKIHQVRSERIPVLLGGEAGLRSAAEGAGAKLKQMGEGTGVYPLFSCKGTGKCRTLWPASQSRSALLTGVFSPLPPLSGLIRCLRSELRCSRREPGAASSTDLSAGGCPVASLTRSVELSWLSSCRSGAGGILAARCRPELPISSAPAPAGWKPALRGEQPRAAPPHPPPPRAPFPSCPGPGGCPGAGGW